MLACQAMTKTVTCANPEDSLLDVLGLMAARGVRHMPVVERGRLVGMVSDRDLLSWAQPVDGDFELPEHLRAADVMAREVVVCDRMAPLASVAAAMVAAHVHALPVIDDEARLVGIVTATDLLRLTADDERT